MSIHGYSFKEYTTQLYKGLSSGVHHQETPVQLYNLVQVAEFLKKPTSILPYEFSFLIHITAGNLEQVLGNEIKIMNAGSVLMVGYGQLTSIRSISEEVKGSFVLFENNMLNEFLTKKDLVKLFLVNPLVSLTEKDSQWINSLNELLYEELNLSTPNPNICSSILGAVLHKVLDSSESGYGHSRSYGIALKFKELAYEYYLEEKGIKWYADQLSISENYLYRCVKATLGKPPKEILLETAIIQSQVLLKDFTKSITEVAYELNFEDPSYFGRLFKQIFGHTPSDYRKCIMQDLS